MTDIANSCSTLGELRVEIDRIDNALLALLRERADVVARVAAYKKRTGTPIRDFSRERDLLAARRARCEELGLAPAPVESIYRQIMVASRDQQAALGAAAPTRIEPRKVAIIGGEGAMGKRLQSLFSDLGHEVWSADLHTDLRPEEAVAAADVTVISVPIAQTKQVVAQLGPLVPKDGLLMDVTSLKGEFLTAMMESTEASVLGSHPMFGPGVHSLIGQRVVLCPGRGDRWFDWVQEMMTARGLVVEVSTAEAHDRAMALVQVLTHFQTQVFGWALSRCGWPLEESLQFTSPAYLMELYVAARHFAQEPELYGPIEMRNPQQAHVTGHFCSAAQELAEVLQSGDQARFAAMFQEVRSYFGDFSAEAVEQSSFLIDRLVERAVG